MKANGICASSVSLIKLLTGATHECSYITQLIVAIREARKQLRFVGKYLRSCWLTLIGKQISACSLLTPVKRVGNRLRLSFVLDTFLFEIISVMAAGLRIRLLMQLRACFKVKLQLLPLGVVWCKRVNKNRAEKQKKNLKFASLDKVWHLGSNATPSLF